MGVRSYKDLLVWQKAVDLAVYCYQITRGFPGEERYGLTSQIRRAAASVPANIAEGHARGSSKEYLRYLGIASGSLAELETHFSIAARLEMLDRKTVEQLFAQSEEISRMLSGLESSIKRKVQAHEHSTS